MLKFGQSMMRANPLRTLASRALCTQASDEAEEFKVRLLEQAMTHVPRVGWSEEALVAAARELGMSPAAAGVCRRGPFELVDHFSTKCDLQLRERISTFASTEYPPP